MDQLRFTGLHEDGTHLVVTAADGSDFAVPIDDRLRASLRQSASMTTARTSAATPREVQTQIRAGLSSEDVASSTGWTVERVQRYEGPILAEREHIAGLARRALVRTHDRSAPPPSLESRVRDRLHVRGVDLDQIQWDSMRPDGGQWSVHVRFMAGQRIRQAAWTFDPAARSVDAIDDEARWLSEDEQSLPAGAVSSALFGAGMDGPDDLMSTMRERSRRRGQGQGRARKSAKTVEQPDDEGDAALDTELGNEEKATSDPAALPGGMTNQALPLEDLPYDPDTMGPPPAAGRASDKDDDAAIQGADEGGGEFADDGGVGFAGDGAVEDENLLEEDPVDGDTAEDSREATLADFFGSDDDFDEDAAEDAAQEETEGISDGTDESSDDETPEPHPPRGRKGRPSVPSWDDIMFGARDKDR